MSFAIWRDFTYIVQFKFRLNLVLFHVVSGQLVEDRATSPTSVVGGGRLRVEVAVRICNHETADDKYAQDKSAQDKWSILSCPIS